MIVSASPVEIAGLGLSFIVGFGLSALHVALWSMSKIAFSRFLEDSARENRAETLDKFEETQLAVEVLRITVFLAFIVYLYAALPELRLRPLVFFLLAFAVSIAGFDLLPRLAAAAGRPAVLKLFLPAFGLLRVLASPVLVVSRRLLAREEKREEQEGEHEASDEEIETFIDEAREEGIIDQDENELLRSVVAFGDTVVREIMTSRVALIAIRKDATIDELKDLIIREKYSRIPVYKDRLDSIEGIVMAKDLLEYADEKHKLQPMEALIRPVSYVPETMEIADLLKELKRSRQKMAVVVDEHGGVSGVVTMEDVLEEIVGEIQDEYDSEEARIHSNGPLDFTVSGLTEVEELEELFDLELAEDDFVTVGGWLTSELGRLPRKGERLEVRGLAVEILDADAKRVRKVRIRKPQGSQ